MQKDKRYGKIGILLQWINFVVAEKRQKTSLLAQASSTPYRMITDKLGMINKFVNRALKNILLSNTPK